MSLEDKLRATPPAPALPNRRPQHPTGPAFEWNGNTGFIQTGPLAERPRTWDAFIRDSGLDPDEVEVLEPVQVRGWDAPAAGGDVVRMHYYRLTVQRRQLQRDLDDLIKAAKRRPRTPTAATETTAHYLVALGDLQLGKADGDGVEGTVARFLDKTKDAADRYRRLRRAHHVGPITLVHLGDCIEGMVSQGGANTWRTTLTTTEQVRLYRRLLLEQVKTFAALTDSLTVCGVPGNHDEAYRPLHTYGDSWAIDAVSAVKDAIDLAGGYEHVTMLAPERDELTLTIDVAGTVIGMAHGHQFPSGNWKRWWQEQGHGRQPIGDADVLLAGHFHHLNVHRETRTFIQVPALESESTWFKHRHGAVSQPGIVTAVVADGSWSSLEVL